MAKNITALNLDNTEFTLRPYVVCSTGGLTSTKTVSVEGFELFTGATVCVKFTYNNATDNPTLNVNNTGAKAIDGSNLLANKAYEFLYDGDKWLILNADIATKYLPITGGQITGSIEVNDEIVVGTEIPVSIGSGNITVGSDISIGSGMFTIGSDISIGSGGITVGSDISIGSGGITIGTGSSATLTTPILKFKQGYISDDGIYLGIGWLNMNRDACSIGTNTTQTYIQGKNINMRSGAPIIINDMNGDPTANRSLSIGTESIKFINRGNVQNSFSYEGLQYPLTIKYDDNVLEYRGGEPSANNQNNTLDLNEIISDPLKDITYQNLKNLRDTGELTPGTKYRIIDYNTTVSTWGYSAENHKYDIIVEALTQTELSEDACACHPKYAGDDYNYDSSDPIHHLELSKDNWYSLNTIPAEISALGVTASDVKYCDTPAYECEVCRLDTTFTYVPGSGNKKYNYLGVELLKDGKVVSADYHRGYAGDATYQNIYTTYVAEPGSYSFRFYVTTIDQNGNYEEIVSNCRILTYELFDAGYFANSNLASWVIKYCLDNNSSRFAWASNDGKGVVYYMKDEHENEAQYDFKNIKIDGYYTFDYEINGNHVDGSVAYGKYCHHNKIAYDVSGPPQMTPGLPKIYFKNTSADAKCYYNIFANDIWSMIFGSGCYKNIFEAGSEGNTLGNNCYHNVFGVECKNNQMGDNCHHNVFDCECSNSRLGEGCYHNVFGRGCQNNVLGSGCNHNTIKCGCSGVSLGDNCIENSFGFNCHSTGDNDYEKIQLEAGCCYNTIGNDCAGIKLQQNCKYNHIGDGSSSIGFKTGAEHNLVEMGWTGTHSNCTSGLSGSRIQYIKDGDDIQYRMTGFAIDTDIINLFV